MAVDLLKQAQSLVDGDLWLTMGDLTELKTLSLSTCSIQITANKQIEELRTYLCNARRIKETMCGLTLAITASTTISSATLLDTLKELSAEYLQLVKDLKRCHETILIGMTNIYADFHQTKSVLADLQKTVGSLDTFFANVVTPTRSGKGSATSEIKVF